MEKLKKYIADNQSKFLEEIASLITIQSVSNSSEHKDDMISAAEWLKKRLMKAGLENATIISNEGHPVVYADWLHAEDKPTVMIYGHYDVIPVEPIDLWTMPPFEAKIENGRIYGRGSTDAKAQIMIPITVAEAFLKTGSIPVNVKFLFEGEEEIGSPSLHNTTVKHKDLLSCDLVICIDGQQWGEDQPAIVTGFRGITSLQIDAYGAKKDLHSGNFGGIVRNPVFDLTQIIASMKDKNGKILVEGFYDHVVPVPEPIYEQLSSVPFNESEFKETVCISKVYGEEDYSPLERNWLRPTLEVNGMWGGYQSEGLKTVIPNEAHVKLSCRLVPMQDPDIIYKHLCEYIHKNKPEGITLNITKLPNSGKPYSIPLDHPGIKLAKAVLEQVYKKTPYFVMMGGSIPSFNVFYEVLHVHSLILGFGLPDENEHSPDEFFRILSFEKGQKTYALLLESLGRKFST